MGKLIRIGMDTSKSVFQLHGVDEKEQVVLRKRLQRRQVLSFFAGLEPTKIGLEACGGSHHWGRELMALGHEVVLVPPQYAKPYVDRNKNDAADAQAICEAMSRPKIQRRFVPAKTVEQQSLQMMIGVRAGLMKRRTQVSNAIRGFASEFGLVSPKGLAHLEPLLARIEQSEAIPALAREMFLMLAGQYRHADAQVREVDKQLLSLHRGNELSRRLAEVPTIGPVGAMSLTAKAGDIHRFGSARDFAAWIGLTPKDHSTAGKRRLGAITRAGDEMLRSQLVCGATALIQHVKRNNGRASPWLKSLIARKNQKLAAVALANKTARIAYRLIISGERYRADYSAAPVKAMAVVMWTTPTQNVGAPNMALPT